MADRVLLSWINTLADADLITPEQATELRQMVRTFNLAPLESARHLGLDPDDPLVWGCLTCRATARHDLEILLGALPTLVVGGMRETERCNNCASLRHTVTNALERVDRRSYDYSLAYRTVLDQVTREEARAYRRTRNLSTQLLHIASQNGVGLDHSPPQRHLAVVS